MVIIGILASLGISNFISSQMKARDSRRKQDLKHVSTAIELYYNDYGTFPEGQGGVIRGCGSGGSVTACPWGSEFSYAGTTYMVQLPVDPQRPSRTYYYESDGTYYELYAYLENTQDSQRNESITTNCGSSESRCSYVITSSNHQL